jgi:hypothetical protein
LTLNDTVLVEHCNDGTVATYLADGQAVSNVTVAMETVLCTIATDMPDIFRGFIDYDAIGVQV